MQVAGLGTGRGPTPALVLGRTLTLTLVLMQVTTRVLMQVTAVLNVAMNFLSMAGLLQTNGDWDFSGGFTFRAFVVLEQALLTLTSYHSLLTIDSILAAYSETGRQ